METENLPIKPSKTPWIILAIIIIVVLSIGAIFSSKLFPKKPKYTAVFLDNGQVYFGKLNGTVLTDVYLLQADNASKPTLSKLTTAIHQPTDEIDLKSSHILYTETLSASSSVIQAINK